LAVRTAGSNGVRPSVRGSAFVALLFGLAGAASLPFAVVAAYETSWWSYLESIWAAIPSAVCGLVAVLAARRAKKQGRRSVLPVKGAGLARWGGRLGWLALYFAATAGLALAVYEIETYYSG
jgi:hypothetical protein